ncbi:MAG TPA: hypothetical protein ENJ93_04565 [Chloroflexi bacterium]|nr:hypothetical protein [Chloroflexota bacterium]
MTPEQKNRRPYLLLLLLIFLAVACRNQPDSQPASQPTPQTEAQPTPTSGPAISEIASNTAVYPNNAIPRYEKLEITFQVDSQAAHPQHPYDPAPPPGIAPEQGITVDALFTPDDWQTVYRQPAFYYQDFLREERDGRNWIYPTADFAWKVRFAPPTAGDWQVKITAVDASGAAESDPIPFTVVPSANKGFLRVSPNDPRYFAFEDGAYFPGLGYNLDVPQNLDEFPVMAANGIQLIRTWIPANWSIFGSAWSPWRSIGPQPPQSEPNARLAHDNALPPGVQPPIAVPGSDLFLWLSYDESVNQRGIMANMVPCVTFGWDSGELAVKPNTEYRVRVRYREAGLAGPLVEGQPFGFTVKTGGWLWDEQDARQRCYAPGAGTVIAATYDGGDWNHAPDPENEGWSLLNGRFRTNDANFLDRFYLALENVTGGNVFVDYVWLEEALPDGRFGSNLIHRPWMAHHQQFDQERAFELDDALAQAEANDIYLKLVVMEKNDYSLNVFNYDGTLSDVPPYRNPQRLFLGAGREEQGQTKTRWLQEAWWRYAQARWGYSTSVHSWELLNEGDPADERFYILADEFGRYMRQFTPNNHLVTTSFWQGFPRDPFWANDNYPNLDYADYHRYIRPDDPFFGDAAAATQRPSERLGALAPDGAGMPVMRGETGWAAQDTGPPIPQLLRDKEGVWLHNFIWGGINPGGMLESYWYVQPHIYVERGERPLDLRNQFGPYYRFIQDVPLANGRYRAAAATVSHEGLRAWGQKDVVNGRAHLWLQNKARTWQNVVQGNPIPPVSGTVALDGFPANTPFAVEWWDSYATDVENAVMKVETVVSDGNGRITLTIENLETDVAVKIAIAD